jgi:hypothetical protein
MRRDWAFVATTVFNRRFLVSAALGWSVLFADPAQAGPNLNNNFKGDITVTRLDFKPRGVAQEYTWFEWYAGNLSRFDVIDAGDNVEKQVFRFLPDNLLTSCNGEAIAIPPPGKKARDYTYVVEKNKCSKKGIPAKDLRPVPRVDAGGFFAFAALATNSGTCVSRVGHNAGTLWTYQLPESKRHKYTEVAVCVASDNSTPHWVAWRGPSRFCSPPPHYGPLPTCEVVGVVFTSFTAGAPPANNFCPSPAAVTSCHLQ